MGEPVTEEPLPQTRPPLLRRLWDSLLVEPLRRVNDESRAFLISEAGQQADWKVIVVLLTATICLTLQNFYVIHGEIPVVARALASVYLDYWVAGNLVVYVVIPALVIHLVFRERLTDYGVKLRGAFSDFWIYGVMFVFMVPLLFFVSTQEHFQRTYPFAQFNRADPLWPGYWRWAAQYAVQFFGLEFFFRGFLVHGTKHRFGSYAIFVMTVPYCMIHYLKPMPEAFGSIGAGVALGYMSLKTRSIWMGTAIHVTVALSMDLISLWRQGLL